MWRLRVTALALGLGLTFIGFSSYGSERAAGRSGNATRGDAIADHIRLLRSGTPQVRAAAAYWLGQQRSAAARAVDPLVELLGDATEVNPSRYRANRILQKLTLGEEAAAALVNIGHPSIDPLIHVLKNSPLPEARKNAAWALGALHDAGATGEEI
jgi:HEAT repeat protein